MMKSTIKTVLCFCLSIGLTGCMTTTGDVHRADVYKSGQVNQMQEVKTVELLAITKTRVEVDNSQAKEKAQIGAGLVGALAGGLLGAQTNTNTRENTLLAGGAGAVVGAAAGSLVASKVLVDGVSLTYSYEGKTYNSAQVGRLCEYKMGTAIMLSADANETRIQPNTQCEEG